MGPCRSTRGRWLLVTEGEHAGRIMLSDTDVIDGRPRFASLAHFLATLLEDTGRILSSGGYVSYGQGEDWFYPLRYLR